MEPRDPEQNIAPEPQPTVPPPTSSTPVENFQPAPTNQIAPTHAEQSAQPATVNVTPQPQPQQPAQHKTTHLTGEAEKLKKLSIQVMVAALIAAAVLAVVSVLAGSFSQTFEKTLFTLFLVIVHALACLAFVEETGKSESSSFKFFENSVFFIIVLSFFTSIFGVWGLIDGGVIAKLYGTYFVLLFACLHGQMLVQTRGRQPYIDNIVNANYVMMGLVIVLILPIIWSGSSSLPDFYYRLLAACGIVDATLTILAVIFHRLYVQKHPEVPSSLFSNATGAPGGSTAQVAQQKRRVHPLIWLLGLYIVGQVVVSVLFAVSGAFFK
jgi:hypothetical protein